MSKRAVSNAKSTQAPPQKTPEAEEPRLYKWEQVKADTELCSRLQDVYGYDFKTAKSMDPPLKGSHMPWKVRDMLGDFLCPHRDPSLDLFKPFSSDDTQEVSVPATELDRVMKLLAEYLKDHYGKSASHVKVIREWLGECKAKYAEVYQDALHRLAIERRYALGVIVGEEAKKANSEDKEEEKEEEEQEEEKKTSKSKNKKKAPKDEEESSSEREDGEAEKEKKQEHPEQQRVSVQDEVPPAKQESVVQDPAPSSQAQEEPEEAGMKLPPPARVHPSIEPPKPVVSVYKAPPTLPTEPISNELEPAAAPLDVFMEDLEQEKQQVPQKKKTTETPVQDEEPPAPALDSMFGEEPEFPQRVFRIVKRPVDEPVMVSPGSVTGSSMIKPSGVLSVQSLYTVTKPVVDRDQSPVKNRRRMHTGGDEGDGLYEGLEMGSAWMSELNDLASAYDNEPAYRTNGTQGQQQQPPRQSTPPQIKRQRLAPLTVEDDSFEKLMNMGQEVPV